MKLKEKIGAVAVSAALVSMAAMPAFAATETSNYDKQTAPGSAESTITGTILPTQVSVTVPTVAAFNLDPFKAAQKEDPGSAGTMLDLPAEQITPPSDYTITNRTPYVPVYVGITEVTVDSALNGGTTSVALTSDPAEVKNVSNTNSIMFTVKDSQTPDIAPADFKTPAEWMTTSIAFGTPFFVDQKAADATADTGKLTAASADGTGGGSLTMSFYGQAAPDASWVAGESFTITPKFTVKTTNWIEALTEAPTDMTVTTPPTP